MDVFEQKKCLESMIVLHDTREQQTQQARDRYSRMGCVVRKATLSFGDYTYNCILPSGQWLYDEGKTIPPTVVIERKMSLDELAMCFCQGRKRFEKEMQRATENGSIIYLLVENASWENLLNGRYRSMFKPRSYEASLTAWTARYHLHVIFCKAETSGELIRETLFRELNEAIERGELDEQIKR